MVETIGYENNIKRTKLHVSLEQSALTYKFSRASKLASGWDFFEIPNPDWASSKNPRNLGDRDLDLKIPKKIPSKNSKNPEIPRNGIGIWKPRKKSESEIPKFGIRDLFATDKGSFRYQYFPESLETSPTNEHVWSGARELRKCYSFWLRISDHPFRSFEFR